MIFSCFLNRTMFVQLNFRVTFGFSSIELFECTCSVVNKFALWITGSFNGERNRNFLVFHEYPQIILFIFSFFFLTKWYLKINFFPFLKCWWNEKIFFSWWKLFIIELRTHDRMYIYCCRKTLTFSRWCIYGRQQCQ